ncbi:hydrolase [Thermococcus sp.]|uniref:hydrolase n=1 Tax=Thermococcus sp. TaxID=35749 RepID=UPI0026042FC3|nr:hydrolase [Thermococcus sp.]
MRRGFIFTLDALLSLLLVMMFVTSIVVIMNNTSRVYSTYMRSQSQHIAFDTLETLRTVPLNQLVPPGKINEWIKNGVINTTYVTPDMTPLDIVATYWAVAPMYNESIQSKFKNNSAKILGYLLNTTLKGYDYELMINNYTSPYLRKVGSNYSKAPDVSSATIIMSGYAYNQTPRGYMARAYLTKLGSKENVYVIRGDYIYARTDYSSQAVDIKYIVPANAIPSDASIEHITWFLEPAWVGSEYKIYLNGQEIWSGYVNDNLKVSDNSRVENELKANFHPGKQNVFEVRVYKRGYDGGEDGAQYIKIKYRTSIPSTLEFPKEFHFEDVTANYGIEIWKYLFVPGKLNSLSIQVAVGNVSKNTPITLSFMFNQSVTISPTNCQYNTSTEIKTCYWSNSTISSTLQNAGYNYTQISSRYTTIVVNAGGRDAYYNPRIHLIGKDSFIKADYDTGLVLTPYTIDITEPISLPDSDWTRNVIINFNVPSGVTPLWVKFQFPWLYSTNYGEPEQVITVDNSKIPATDLYRHPPDPFIYALARVGYTANTFDYQYKSLPNAIANGANTLQITLGNGYQLQPKNGDGTLTYVIQAYAGYGNVFPKFIRDGCGGYNITYYWQGDSNPHYILAGNEPYCNISATQLLEGRKTYAVDDAIVRLFNNLGGNGTQADPLLVELPSTVTIDFASMGNIPGLFQPMQITLRVWREH